MTEAPAPPQTFHLSEMPTPIPDHLRAVSQASQYTSEVNYDTATEGDDSDSGDEQTLRERPLSISTLRNQDHDPHVGEAR